ncbi:MAG: hypothetical protein CL526_07750 [Aequorivita sp.]|nr:hypothetical protein [Aequorivita sp.]|tara:strand:+ start:13082 stop:14140 length:1059 start_codon:yes stop_codon:yes gene_type:complete
MQYKILFVLPVSTQPRFSKRIQNYLDRGYEVTVASFEREYFKKNSLPENIKFLSLGKIESGAYIKRIPKIVSVFNKIYKLSKKNDLIYIFSPDILLFTFSFLKSSKLYYEIGDIRQISGNQAVSNLYDGIYKKALKKCSKIFVTSTGFKRFFADKYSVDVMKFRVIENKLPVSLFSPFDRSEFRHIKSSSYIVSIIGLLRYKNIISFLTAYYKADAKFKIKIFGDGPLRDEIMKFVDNDNVQYFGQFRNPDDLFEIYNQTDLSFTMYNSKNKNVQLALPNKLYESIYFRRPILVSADTYLEEMVNKYQVGFFWKQEDMKGLISYMTSESFIKDYNRLCANFDLINQNVYLAK